MRFPSVSDEANKNNSNNYNVHILSVHEIITKDALKRINVNL